MSMNVNMDASRLASLYQTALEGAGIENVTVAASEDGKSLTVTTHNADGSVNSTQMLGDVPEIDLPAGTAVGDSEQLAVLTQQLGELVQLLSGLGDADLEAFESNFNQSVEKFVAETSASQQGGGETGKVSAMYCIFRLMSLMLDVAREQREVAREQREADSQMVLHEMECQRQSMIDNAVAGMISSVCVAAIQLGMIGVSAMRDNSLRQMKSDNKLASGEKTFENINNMSAKANNPQAMDTVKGNAETKLTQASETLVKDFDTTDAERSNALGAQNDVDARFAQIEGMKEPEVRQAMHSDKPLTEQQVSDFKAAEREKVYSDLKTERNAAKQEFLRTAETGKADPAARQKLEIANAKLEYAAASQLKAHPEDATSLQASSDRDMRNARMYGGGLDDQIAKQEHRNQIFDQVSSTICSTIRDLSTQGNTLREEESKKYDQSVELSREQREMSKHLVASALDMFKNMLNVLNSILESEKSTFREIMG